MPSDTARLWPYFVSDNNRRASESKLRPLKKPCSDGMETAKTIISSAITRINSINVNAVCCLLLLLWLLPISNIIITACASVRSHGHHVIRTRVVLAGAFINIGMPPGIVRDFTLQIGAFPALCVPRLLDKIKQAILSLGIIPIVHLERIQ